MRVIVPAVASDLTADEGRLCVFLSLTSKFYLSHYKSLIVAIKLVNLKHVVGAAHKITGLVDNAGLAELKELLCLVNSYLLLKLITAETSRVRRSLDGEIPLIVTNANTDGFTARAANIALFDAALRKSLLPIGGVAHQKFAFYLKSTHDIMAKTQHV